MIGHYTRSSRISSNCSSSSCKTSTGNVSLAGLVIDFTNPGSKQMNQPYVVWVGLYGCFSCTVAGAGVADKMTANTLANTKQSVCLKVAGLFKHLTKFRMPCFAIYQTSVSQNFTVHLGNSPVKVKDTYLMNNNQPMAENLCGDWYLVCSTRSVVPEIAFRFPFFRNGKIVNGRTSSRRVRTHALTLKAHGLYSCHGRVH